KGLWVIPGEYVVTLSINDWNQSVPLLIKKEERVNALQSDFVKQFEFAEKIQAERLRIAQASTQARALLKQAAELRAKSTGPVAQKMEEFESAITELTELRARPVQYGLPGSFPEKTSSLSYLGSALANLQHVVDDVDAAPSPDALKGFEKERIAVNEALKRWAQFKTQWLPNLNSLLQP